MIKAENNVQKQDNISLERERKFTERLKDKERKRAEQAPLKLGVHAKWQLNDLFPRNMLQFSADFDNVILWYYKRYDLEAQVDAISCEKDALMQQFQDLSSRSV